MISTMLPYPNKEQLVAIYIYMIFSFLMLVSYSIVNIPLKKVKKIENILF